VSVASDQRFRNAANPCPVCGGWDLMPRGQGTRCSGFRSDDGEWIHCSREEHAGSLALDGAGTYPHKARGDCKCGTSHGYRPPREEPSRYVYQSHDGLPLFRVNVQGHGSGKKVWQDHWNGSDWAKGLNGAKRVLYRLPEVLAAMGPIYLTEGERDVETLRALGLTATTTSGGATNWRHTADHARQFLANRDVMIIRDKDAPGLKYATDAYEDLYPVVRTIATLECPVEKDITDHIAAGGTLDQLVEMQRKAPSPDPNEGPPEWGDDEPPPSGESMGAQPSRRVWTPVERVAEWAKDGPLVHEPTGIDKLDELTGGGPVYGSRWYVQGAPNASKTLLFVHVADEWARRGIVVGLLAVDEEADDITTRLAQRAKFRRDECETREPATLLEMQEALEPCPIRMYGPEWTIQDAADDLARYAKERSGNRIALLVDSIQAVACPPMLTEREPSERERVNVNIRALRDAAARVRAIDPAHRLIAMATSEMNRNAYRTVASAEQYNDMAAGKESGAIEYSARVLVSLRSVKGDGNLIEVRMVKNKHGESGDEAGFYLALDRRRQTLAVGEAPHEAERNEQAEQAENEAAVEADAIKLLRIIVDKPDRGSRGLAAEAKAAGLAWGVRRMDAALAKLLGTRRVEDRTTVRGKVTDHHLHAVSG
jgi:hypothetical protein